MKFKQIIAIAIFAILFSCTREISESDTVTLISTNDIIPTSYVDDNTITFVNGNEDEITLIVLRVDQITETEYSEDKSKDTQSIQIRLIEHDMDVNILFSIAAILTTDGEKKHEEATYTLNPFDSPSVSVTILIEEMTPLSTQTVTEADVTLIGESFDDVTLVSQDGQFSFSVLYISKVLGVIGFRDRSNELWVLKR